jgi:hypothetical protein
MRIRSLLTVLFLTSSTSFAQSPRPQFTMDWQAIAEQIVQQLSLEPGEKVLAVTHPGLFEEAIPHFRYAVMKAGGVDLGVIGVLERPMPGNWDRDIVGGAVPPAREAYRSMLRDVDVSVMFPGAQPSHPAYGAIQDLLREGRGRTIHFHWLENGSAFALPGQPLPASYLMSATYQRAVLELDYQALAESQRRFEAAMRAGEVRITSPLGTDIRFRVGDRPVSLQNGNASAERASKAVILIDREIELPCGAIRDAPLEETVEGTIAFPPSQWNDRPVNGLKLRFEKGRVVEIHAESGQDHVEAEMSEAGAAGQSFREFAPGFNPELAVPEESPWIPYYGYGAGVVRLSLGDNSELGGTVTGGYVRWNFFTDTTVSVGGEVWVRDGKLVR